MDWWNNRKVPLFFQQLTRWWFMTRRLTIFYQYQISPYDIVHGQHYCHYMSIHFSVFSWWTNNLWTNEFWSICLRTHLPGPIHVATGWVGKKHPPRLATRSFKAQAKHKDVTTLKIHIDVGHPLFVDCFPKETMGFPHLCLFT